MKLYAAMLVLCLGAAVAHAEDKNTVVNSPGTKVVSTVTVNGRTKGTVTTYGADGKPKTTKVDRKAAVKQKDDGDDMTDPMDDHADLKQAGEGGSVSAGGKTVKTKPGDKVQVINNTIYVNGKKR